MHVSELDNKRVDLAEFPEGMIIDVICLEVSTCMLSSLKVKTCHALGCLMPLIAFSMFAIPSISRAFGSLTHHKCMPCGGSVASLPAQGFLYTNSSKACQQVLRTALIDRVNQLTCMWLAVQVLNTGRLRLSRREVLAADRAREEAGGMGDDDDAESLSSASSSGSQLSASTAAEAPSSNGWSALASEPVKPLRPQSGALVPAVGQIFL